MAYVGESENIMKPKKGDSSINLPITFGYSGGRKDTFKSKIIWVIVLSIIGIIIGIGTVFSEDGVFIFNLFLGLFIMYIMSLIIRFPILGEHKIRNRMLELDEKDFVKDTKDLWGIFSVDDIRPYYSHLRSGRSALYVKFEKDVILGKTDVSEYEHYDAISDAYNLAGSMKIGMCHIDYMDKVGKDDRLVECFSTLPSVENPDVRDLLTDIYTNLEELMNENVATFDVYVFTFKGSESTFWYNIQKVIACMLEANYVSFQILDSSDLRDLSKSLFNMNDFSVNEAYLKVFDSNKSSSIIPISVLHADGTEEVLNKTMAEKREERKQKERELQLKKEEGKGRKKNKKVKVKKVKDEEEIDIF